MVEVWDLGGTRGAKQLKKLADNPSEVIGNSTFLGRAEIPLVDTLTSTQRGVKLNSICMPVLPWHVLGACLVCAHVAEECSSMLLQVAA